MGRAFGSDRLAAVLSGIATSTRMKYLQSWRHWEAFMVDRQLSPWIWRTSPDWDDHLVDFILFESKVIANSPGAIRGGISSLRFWHLLAGMPDFAWGEAAMSKFLMG